MTPADNEAESQGRDAAQDEPSGDRAAWPDWRNSDHYRHLSRLDRAGWAWEWLRRHLAYQQAMPHQKVDEAVPPYPSLALLKPRSDQLAHQWGLCFRGECRLSRHACTTALGWPMRSLSFDRRRGQGLPRRSGRLGCDALYFNDDGGHFTRWW